MQLVAFQSAIEPAKHWVGGGEDVWVSLASEYYVPYLHLLIVCEPVVLALHPGPVNQGLAVSGQPGEGAGNVAVYLHNLQTI